MTAEASNEPLVTIAGLAHVRVETLVAITNQLRRGARLWRYDKITQAELLQFAEFFGAEVRRHDGIAAAKPAPGQQRPIDHAS